VTGADQTGRVSADSAAAPGVALGFGSVRQLLHAGELLRAAGFDVLVVPRRAPGCGALLLIEQHAFAAALAVLASGRVPPSEVRPYSTQEVDHE